MQTDLLKIKTTLANWICHIRSRSILKLVALASCLVGLASVSAAPAVQPFCVDFNNCPTGGGFSGFSGQGAACDCGGPGPSGNSASDFCFECADGSGNPSFITASSSFYGDWTGIASSCGEFCYDFQLKNDGDGSTHAGIVPNFDLIGPGGKGFRFTLTTPAFVTEPGGANPGWHSICAPIAPLQSGNLPTISGGFWAPLPGTANSDWPTVLADVVSIHINFDQTPLTEDVCIDNVCLRLCQSSVNKDLVNNTGQSSDGLEIILSGPYSLSDVGHYDGPYYSGGAAQPNSTFPNFGVSQSGGNTILRWSGQTIPSNGRAHVGFEVPGLPAQFLAVRWTQGGNILGCADQLSQHRWGNDRFVVYDNDLSLCQPSSRYVGHWIVEYHAGAVSLAELNSLGTKQKPLARYALTNAPMLLAPGGSVAVQMPPVPAGARYGVLIYDVSFDPALAERARTTDYTQVLLTPAQAALVITRQPQSQTVIESSSATFTVAATVAQGAITYQWRKDRVNLTDGRPFSGVKTPALTINPVTAADQGAYDVVVVGIAGQEISMEAVLTVSKSACCDAKVWILAATAGPDRSRHSMVYDSARDRVLLFGGLTGFTGTASDETWEWNGATAIWTQRLPSLKPSPRAWFAMAYDSMRQVTVLFGGDNNRETWEWNGQLGTWTLRSQNSGPPRRDNLAMAYDIDNHVTLLFGGTDGTTSTVFDDTWEWDGAAGTWIQRFPTIKPGKRQLHAMAYDSNRKEVVLFGGDNGSGVVLGDTWEWDGNTKQWTQRSNIGPAARNIHSLAYDSECHRVVLFGGYSATAGSLLGDTWEWNGAVGTWTQQFPPSAIPSARGNHALAYDSVRSSVVLFGGEDNAGDFSGTWEWRIPGSSAGPAISQSPANLILTAGQTATFSVVAVGSGTLSYQWRKNGVNISGANTPMLTINTTVLADAGSYDVLVSDACGSVISVVATLNFQMPGECLKAPPGMIAWYPFDETSGTVAQDYFGGPNGTVNGGATFGPGMVGNGLNFDGVDDYVRVPNPPLNLQAQFSMDAWIYPTSPDSLIIATKEKLVATTGGKQGFVFNVNGGFLNFSYGDGAPVSYELTQSSSTAIPLNVWSLVAVTVDRTASPAIKLYRNGVLLNAANTSITGDINNDADLLIGRFADYAPGEFFAGKLDELEIFNRALSESEVLALYNAGPLGKCKPPCLADLWIKDTMAPDLAEDFGVEPNTLSSVLYISRDIWVRNAADTVTGTSANPGPDTTLPLDRYYAHEHQHQNPVFVNATTPNYLYVKVRNRGCAWSTGKETLRVYWASASTGLPWPGAAGIWNEIDCVAGGLTDACWLPPLAPGQDYVAQLAWVPPTPAAFGGNDHFCLVARIEEVSTPPFGMAYAEGPVLWQNVAQNNNIAWKNVTVVTSVSGGGTVIVRNTLERAEQLALRFAVPAAESKDHFLMHGDIFVNLGAAVMEKWRLSGQRAVGFAVVGNSTQIQIMDPTNAVLNGLFFEKGEEQTIEVGMQMKPGDKAAAGTTFNWDVIQLAPLTPIAPPSAMGGERYTFIVPDQTSPAITSQPQSLTLTPGQAATFTVAATGAPPLSYQWFFNGTNIIGATNTTHTIFNAQTNNAGDYVVLVSNASGSATSAQARLAMLIPYITTVTLVCANGTPLAGCEVTISYYSVPLGLLGSGTASTDASGQAFIDVGYDDPLGSPNNYFVVSTPCCPNQTWTMPASASLGILTCTNVCVLPGTSICGMKWGDLNGDGIKDPNEPGLSGWQIRLMPGNLLATTDANGNYCFTGLAPGTYTLNEILTGHPDWTQTFPTPGTYTITLPDDIATDINFGNKAPCLSELPANMVAWWTLDELAGATVLQDLVGGNHATTFSGPVGGGGPNDALGLVQGAQYFRDSFAFNYGEAPDAAALRFDTSIPGEGDFSIDAWVYVPSVMNAYPIRPIVDKMQFKANSSTWKGYALSISGGVLQLTLNNSSYVDVLTVPMGQWTFIGVQVSRNSSGALVQFYVNGQMSPAQTGPAVTLDNSATLRIGDYRLSSFVGPIIIDELEMFNRALPKADFDGIFQAGSSGKCKPTAFANKDFTNNTGQAVDGIEWLVQGTYPSVTWHYDGPYYTPPAPGTPVPNTTFSSFTIVPSGSDTLLRWSGGASIPNNGKAHVGFGVNGSSLTTLGASWRIGGAYAGCVHQVSVGEGFSHIGGEVVFQNTATNCESQLLYVGNVRLEWFSASVPLAQLNAAGVRSPLRADDISSPPISLAPGASAPLAIPLAPLGARYAMIRYTVSASPTLAGLGNTIDYQEVTLRNTQPPTLTCATNKTVNCGTAWSFDAPTVVDGCSPAGGITLTILSTATNGLCPQIIKRTWAVTDLCGNSNTCSQTVTLRDTERPTITCPTNRIFVALGTNCQLEIPTIHPPASDNCTPDSQLVYTQNPAAGTIVPGPCQNVTVTVRDACDNASQCQVLVCGQDKTPPTVIYPKSVTVTNCLVPDVLALVSASDNCTASNQLVFTQSPPAGTTIAAGGNLVTVTVTDLAGNATTVVISLINTGTTSFLPNLFNTGVDASKVVLPGGSVDSHYTLGPVPGGLPTGAGFYNPPNAIVATSPWGLPPFTFSRWIAPAQNSLFCLPGSYTYTNQFTLPSGANQLTASISGRWAADDGARMYLNGLALANQVSFIPASSGFSYWTYFTANNGFLPFPQVNKLYCVVTNTIIYTGVRVEITNAVVNCSICTPPVILHKIPSQSQPLNSVAVFSVSVGGTPPLTFQWYHNGLPLSNGGHYSGVSTATLIITPVGYADAGTYYVVISNPCGEIHSNTPKLTVTHGWPWWWAWWNVSYIGNPMKATFGPDLVMKGTNTFGISSGTTRDFDLPNIGGQIANVMYVPPLLGDTFIQMPFVTPPGSDSVSNYTVIMDVLVPSNSTNRAMFFSIFDRWGNMIRLESAPGAAGEVLRLGGTVGGTPFNLVSPMPLPLGKWNRIAMVCGDNIFENDETFTLSLYLDGKFAGSTSFNAPPGAVSISSDTEVAVFSSRDGTAGELYAASLQFHAFAFTPEMIAGLGGPDNGPIPANDTSFGVSPVLSANISNGIVNLSWTGSAFLLRETSDLTRGVWVDSLVAFDEAEVNGGITTTAHVNPALEGRAKFFKLIYAP